MFVWVHVTAAILLGIVLKRFMSINVFLLIGIAIAGQAIDLDHYSGSMYTLIRCGFVLSYSEPMKQVCYSSLHRGFLHSYITPFVLAAIATVLCVDIKDRKYLDMYFCLMLAVTLHMVLDTIEVLMLR